ncbi:MAG: hypothetical protein NKF70_13705 [Methanobacterium sp. ERen5]|nr:MAG: hypothetical protein NKF70_13705 [Methanobacterium sp. ERen5]
MSDGENEGEKRKRINTEPESDEDLLEESERFPDAEEERMEVAPADLLEKERPDLLKKEYGKNVKVNPQENS